MAWNRRTGQTRRIIQGLIEFHVLPQFHLRPQLGRILWKGARAGKGHLSCRRRVLPESGVQIRISWTDPPVRGSVPVDRDLTAIIGTVRLEVVEKGDFVLERRA